jgi:hypothetical protein
MFLTTNRVESIDSAFKSRIHLSLYYSELSTDARSSIWKANIARGCGSVSPEWLNKNLLHRLAAYDINGRQIKNTIRMACSIAANEQRELQAKDILKGLEAWTSFETDFGTRRRSKRRNVAAVLRMVGGGMRYHAWAGVLSAVKLSMHFPKYFIHSRPLRFLRSSRRARQSRGRVD